MNMNDYEYKKNVNLLCSIWKDDINLVVDYPEILLKECDNKFPCLILVKYKDICNEIIKLEEIDLEEEVLRVQRFNGKNFPAWSLVSIFITQEEINTFNNLLK